VRPKVLRQPRAALLCRKVGSGLTATWERLASTTSVRSGPHEVVDRPTLELVYQRISPRLHGYVRRAEPSDADDICADVWLAVVRYLPMFRGDADGLEALVFTIARRRIIDHRRRRSRRRTDVVDTHSLVERPGSDETELTALNELRSRAALVELARRLPVAQVDVVVLRVMHGLPVECVATILGRSPGAVRLLQHRALQRLRAS
jgi:RNA polymerase sigma-70 factor, ECF subfamily